LEFIFGVIDPFINECWGYFAVDFNEDDPPYENFVPALIRFEIRFLVSPKLIKHLPYMEFKWNKSGAFRKEMKERIAVASKAGAKSG
jgi:hypothetical protein